MVTSARILVPDLPYSDHLTTPNRAATISEASNGAGWSPHVSHPRQPWPPETVHGGHPGGRPAGNGELTGGVQPSGRSPGYRTGLSVCLHRARLAGAFPFPFVRKDLVMSIMFIVAFILFVVGAILVVVPDGRLFKVGLALVLVGLFLAVFLPGMK